VCLGLNRVYLPIDMMVKTFFLLLKKVKGMGIGATDHRFRKIKNTRAYRTPRLR
jgi:hypothetical protein